MAEKSPMTVKGHQRLQEEVRRLKTVDRIQASKAIEIARAHGDLSENAEYDAAKNAQGLLEARIRDLESKLSMAQVVDISALSGSKVVFGATVQIIDLTTDESRRISIVGEEESAVEHGLISFKSPLARALIGKQAGDIAQVRLPAGEKEYEIVDVQFIEIALIEK